MKNQAVQRIRFVNSRSNDQLVVKERPPLSYVMLVIACNVDAKDDYRSNVQF